MNKFNVLYMAIFISLFSSLNFQVRADVNQESSFDTTRHIIRKLQNDIKKVESQQVQDALCTLALGGSWGYIISLFMDAYKFNDNGLAKIAAGLTGSHIIVTFLLGCKLIYSDDCLKKELAFLKNELELALASQQSSEAQLAETTA